MVLKEFRFQYFWSLFLFGDAVDWDLPQQSECNSESFRTKKNHQMLCASNCCQGSKLHTSDIVSPQCKHCAFKGCSAPLKKKITKRTLRCSISFIAGVWLLLRSVQAGSGVQGALEAKGGVDVQRPWELVDQRLGKYLFDGHLWFRQCGAANKALRNEGLAKKATGGTKKMHKHGQRWRRWWNDEKNNNKYPK